MRKIKRVVFLLPLLVLAVSSPAEEPPREAFEPPEPDRLLGASVVIDPAHIAKTVAQTAIEIAIRELQKEGVDLQRVDLERLFQIPFVDGQNFTGAFLANMLFEHGAPDSPLPSISIFHPEVEEILRDLFPAWVPYGEIPTDFVDLPIETALDWERILYLLRREEAARLIRIFREHAAQLSRERQGLWAQRLSLPGAEGSVQHLEHIAAVLHQVADAQSVERQLLLLDLNRRVVHEMQEDARVAQRTATILQILDAWSPPGSSPPRIRHGHRVSEWFT